MHRRPHPAVTCAQAMRQLFGKPKPLHRQLARGPWRYRVHLYACIMPQDRVGLSRIFADPFVDSYHFGLRGHLLESRTDRQFKWL
jgi:hypothetical protein